VTVASSAQSSVIIWSLCKNLLQGIHRSRIRSTRSASIEFVSIHKIRRNSVRFLFRKCKATIARCAQSSQGLKSWVNICCKECTGMEFDEESKRLRKEVEG
jgi:hypothetical protein